MIEQNFQGILLLCLLSSFIPFVPSLPSWLVSSYRLSDPWYSGKNRWHFSLLYQACHKRHNGQIDGSFLLLGHLSDCPIWEWYKTYLKDHHHVDACSHLQTLVKMTLSKNGRCNCPISGILSLHDSAVCSKFEMIAALARGREAEFVEEYFYSVVLDFISALSPESDLRLDRILLCTECSCKLWIDLYMTISLKVYNPGKD